MYEFNVRCWCTGKVYLDCNAVGPPELAAIIKPSAAIIKPSAAIIKQLAVIIKQLAAIITKVQSNVFTPFGPASWLV